MQQLHANEQFWNLPQLTSHEVVSFYISRIKSVNPVLNAVVEDRFSEALEEAKKVDEYLQNTKLSVAELARTKPLLGVPITVKESCSLAGTNSQQKCFVLHRCIVESARISSAIFAGHISTRSMALGMEH